MCSKETGVAFQLLKLMNHDIDDKGYPHTFQKLKNSCRNFDEAGSAITIGNNSSSYLDTDCYLEKKLVKKKYNK